MRLGDLEKMGISERVIEVWRERQGESLLPVQRQAVRRGLLDSEAGGKRNMIISAPTSSGKLFCAEMAAVRALANRQKAVLLFPLKSLAEEKYRLFQETYGRLGIKCLIATGDHPENDEKFLCSDFQLALGIYEKFDLLLAADLDALSNIGLVVIDELQMLAEPTRGAILERLLTRILASVYSPSVVALSAVLNDCSADRLASWLSAQMVRENTRPVDLLRGVATGGSLRLRSFNKGDDSTEPFGTVEIGDDPAEAFLARLRAGSGTTLVFLKSRQDTVQGAYRLAASVQWPEAKTALNSLKEEEPSCLVRALTQAMTHGVAFHNSDLTPRQRSVVEQAFVNGEVRTLFSTTTLALGVNLPADTVYLETVRYASGSYDSRPVLVPISRAEFDNMTGRAGRLGLGTDRPGRAIIMADSEFDRDVLWETYIAPDQPESLCSAFHSLPVEDWLLHMVCAGLVDSATAASLVFKRSLRALESPAEEAGFELAIERLTGHGLICVNTEGQIAATSAGKAVALAGLSLNEALHFQRQLDEGHPETTLGWTALALSSPDWSLPPSILTRLEQANNLPLKALYQRLGHSLREVSCLVPETCRQGPLSYRLAASLKALLLLDDWCKMLPVQRIEEQYQLHLGQILSLGETVAHLVTALAVLLRTSDGRSQAVDGLSEHAFSLRHGLSPELLPLHRCFGSILSRSDFTALRDAGITTPAQLSELSADQRAGILRGENKSILINQQISLLRKESKDMASSLGNHVFGGAEPESVEIDGGCEQERFLVRINGFPVRLTGKSFKYFTKLAWSRVAREAGWIYKEDIEIGFNQARYLYRMKNEIAAGFSSAWPIIENNRLGYYRLQVGPDKIKINENKLRNHPDWEIRSLFTVAGTPGIVS